MHKPSRSIAVRAAASAVCSENSLAGCARDQRHSETNCRASVSDATCSGVSQKRPTNASITPMIQLNRNYNLPEKTEEEIPIKVVGVGDAGSNVLDRIVLDGLNKADLIAINTDVQSLASSVAAHKVQLGRTVTRGLGAGGDPDVGYNAAYESADEIRQALAEARMIF